MNQRTSQNVRRFLGRVIEKLLNYTYDNRDIEQIVEDCIKVLRVQKMKRRAGAISSGPTRSEHTMITLRLLA